jgi:predicted outer membrane protein
MSTRFLVAALAVAIAPACGSSDNTVPIGDPVGDTVDEGHAHGDNIAAQASGELAADDYMTVIGKTASILAALNDGEINESAFAVQILGDQDIFQFANDMIAEHEDANTQLDDVVRIYGVGYIPSQTEATLAAEASQDLATLRGTSPGNFDFQYTELQVISHAEAQVLLDQLSSIVGPGEMDDYIANARSMVDDHLNRATDLLQTFY